MKSHDIMNAKDIPQAKNVQLMNATRFSTRIRIRGSGICSRCKCFVHHPTHSIHVWYIYLHLVDFYGINVGKYTSPMDPMSFVFCSSPNAPSLEQLPMGPSCSTSGVYDRFIYDQIGDHPLEFNVQSPEILLKSWLVHRDLYISNNGSLYSLWGSFSSPYIHLK